MFTTLRYNAFGIRGYKHISTRCRGGAVYFTVRQDRCDWCCPECGSHKAKPRGRVWRQWRLLPMGRKMVWLVLAVPRVLCLACGVLPQVKTDFASRRRSFCRAFERYALGLSRHMTIKDVPQYLGVSWDVVKNIQKEKSGKALCPAQAA